MIKKAIKRKIFSILNNILNEDISYSNNLYQINFKSNSGKIKSPTQVQGGKYICVGSTSVIGKYSWIGALQEYSGFLYSPQILIGDNVNIGNFACITAIDKITIGDNCLISEHVYMSDHAHGLKASKDIPIVEQPLYSKGEVIIGNNCFIGLRVSILPGVQLGEHCIVGAHSLVNNSFPAYSMIAGSPAKLIKKYSFELNKWIPVINN
jgi:lipopolysaccharide O-acetyltransferase